MVIDPAVPTPQNPVGPTATLDGTRDLVKQKDDERKKDSQLKHPTGSDYASRKASKPSAPSIPASVDYPSLVFKVAVNNKFAKQTFRLPSTYIPNFGVTFYILSQMDRTMASTKAWTDTSLGWAPPMSQMYISLLIYIQIIRAMETARMLQPFSQLKIFLDTFRQIFPLEQLQIPGPLVPLFASISSFLPFTDGRFGNVCPSLPDAPHWTAATFFTPGQLQMTDTLNKCLPNISVFVSRLRSICQTATSAAVTDQRSFMSSQDSPHRCATLFGRQIDDTENAILSSPGSMFAYPDQLDMWINAANSLDNLGIPQDLSLAAPQTAPNNDWTSFLRLSQFTNEHLWVEPISAIMADYSRYWNGSTNLGSISTDCQTSAAVKMRFDQIGTSIHDPPSTRAEVLAQPQAVPPVAAYPQYYIMRTHATSRFDCQVALKTVPKAHIYSALTYSLNAYSDIDEQNAARNGPFWNLGPNYLGREGIQTLTGVLSTVAREYPNRP